jgi:uncharacterized OB-fold protein
MVESADTAGAGALSPPIPGKHPTHQFYWDAVARREIQLLKCLDCGHFVHYPRPVCPHCLSSDLRPETISGKGTLYSYTVVMQPGHPYFVDKIPYVIGVFEIDEEPGVRMPRGIDAAPEVLRCGMPMEVVFKDVTDTLVLPFFRPAELSGGAVAAERSPQ